MSTRRTTGVRRTTVRHGDARIAGPYRCTAHTFWQSSIEATAPISAHGRGRNADSATRSSTTPPVAHIVSFGRLDALQLLDQRRLCELRRELDDGRSGIPMVDVLAAVRLDATADVVVFSDGRSDELAVPVRDLMSDGALVFDPPSGAHQAGGLFTLDLPGWTDDTLSMAPRSMQALSFQEFVTWH